MRIYISDIRAAGHCVKGIKSWFDAHDLDFRRFLQEGIEETTFIESGDALAVRVVELKKRVS